MRRTDSLPRRILGITGKVLAYLVMGIFAMMTIFPIIWLIINSFKSNAEYYLSKLALPHGLQFVNYSGAWNVGDFKELIGNSFICSVSTTELTSALARFSPSREATTSTFSDAEPTASCASTVRISANCMTMSFTVTGRKPSLAIST